MTNISAKFQNPDEMIMAVTITQNLKWWKEFCKVAASGQYYQPVDEYMREICSLVARVESEFREGT